MFCCSHWLRPFSTGRNFARGPTFCVRLKKLNCFKLCGFTILAENDAPRAKFRPVEKQAFQLSTILNSKSGVTMLNNIVEKCEQCG